MEIAVAVLAAVVGAAAGALVAHRLAVRHDAKKEAREQRHREGERGRAAALQLADTVRGMRAEIGPWLENPCVRDARNPEWGDGERERAAEMAALMDPRVEELERIRLAVTGSAVDLWGTLYAATNLIRTSRNALRAGTPSPAALLIDNTVKHWISPRSSTWSGKSRPPAIC